jgi:hypothetical protein
MSAFGASELDKLERILEEVVAEARGRRLGLTREVAARRLFDAARAGKKDKAALKAAAFGADNDDEPFPPDLGMRPLPIPKPIWPVSGLAA